MSAAEFFSMDGYALYVWPCYALTLIVLVGIGVSARRSLAAEQTRAIRRAQANQE
jgi:heme exporter protein CcmD